MNNLNIYYRAAGVCGIHFNRPTNPSILLLSEVRQNAKSLNFPGGKKRQYRINFKCDIQTIKDIINEGKDEGVIDIYIKSLKQPKLYTVVNFKNSKCEEDYIKGKLKNIEYEKEEKDFIEYTEDSEMDPVETANREFKEETNISHFIPVKPGDPFIYVPSAKYCLYFCKLPDDFNRYIKENKCEHLQLIPYNQIWNTKENHISSFSSFIIKTPQFKTKLDEFILLENINNLSIENESNDDQTKK